MTQTKNHTIQLSTAVFFLIGVFAFPTLSHASIVASQPDSTGVFHHRAENDSGVGIISRYCLETDSDPLINTAYLYSAFTQIYAHADVVGTVSLYMGIDAYSSADCSGSALASSNTNSLTPNDYTAPLLRFDLQTPINLYSVHSVRYSFFNSGASNLNKGFWFKSDIASDAAYYCCSYGNPYIVFVDNLVSFVQLINGRSSIISVTPSRRVATSSPVYISAYTSISQGDINSNLYVTVSFAITKLQPFKVTPWNTSQQLLFSQDVAGSGYFTVATSSILDTGAYQMWTYIRDKYGVVINSTSTVFSVGAISTGEQAAMGMASDEIDVSTALTATTTAGYAAQCAVWYGNSGAFHDCVAYLFVPQTNVIGEALQNLIHSILYAFPIGYATRVVDIFQNANTNGNVAVLPSLVITMPTGFPGAGATFDLTPWNLLMGAGTMISTAVNPNTGHTLREVVEPTWDSMIYALFVLVMAMDILGMSKVGIADIDVESETGYKTRRIFSRRL